MGRQRKGNGPKEVKVDISFNLGGKEQRGCSVKKVTERLKESPNGMKIVHTLLDALPRSVALAWLGRLTPLCYLPGGCALLFQLITWKCGM